MAAVCPATLVHPGVRLPDRGPGGASPPADAAPRLLTHQAGFSGLGPRSGSSAPFCTPLEGSPWGEVGVPPGGHSLSASPWPGAA
eukprot:11296095-Alexandrium_andersonii.AAC.1